ncbi:dTMP kinase [Patescibacteria group bacterium]|nr:dTMP kinase [Patescibacteria group bacterium]
MTKLQKGKLIVIEGLDGSGKTTQLKLLKSYFEKNNTPFETISFPRYKKSFHGRTVAKYLRGEFGETDSVNPYLVSLAYAMDRATAKWKMNKWLREGKIIITDRYATSNMAHQAAKLPEKERDKFLKWDEELEYKVNKIPKENIVVYLYVSVEVAKNKTKSRGKQDIHERDFNYLVETGNMYEKLSRRYKHWVKINCEKKGKLRSKEDIHKEIVKVLRKNKII